MALITPEQSLQYARNLVQFVISEDAHADSTVITVASEVGAEIVEEIIPQGGDLNSVELARRYGLSRTPVREALLMLEKQGLVVIQPRRRPRAGMIDFDRARELFRARSVLMASIASDIVWSAGEQDIDSLERENERMAKAEAVGDHREFFWANTDFHIKNVAIARNQTVQQIVNSLLLRSMWLRRLTLDVPSRRRESLAEHQQLVRAYRQKDVALAELLSRLIHLNALRTMEQKLAERQAMQALADG